MNARRQDQLIEELAGRLRRWGMVAPGVAFLEAHKPVCFLGSQLILFMQPLLGAFVSTSVTGEYAALLADRDNVEQLVRKLEVDSSGTATEDARWK